MSNIRPCHYHTRDHNKLHGLLKESNYSNFLRLLEKDKNLVFTMAYVVCHGEGPALIWVQVLLWSGQESCSGLGEGRAIEELRHLHLSEIKFCSN